MLNDFIRMLFPSLDTDTFDKQRLYARIGCGSNQYVDSALWKMTGNVLEHEVLKDQILVRLEGLDEGPLHKRGSGASTLDFLSYFRHFMHGESTCYFCISGLNLPGTIDEFELDTEATFGEQRQDWEVHED